MEKMELLTPEAVAARLHVVRRTLQRWRASGLGPAYVRLGPRRIAYSRDALEAWVDTCSYQSNAAEATRQPQTSLEERPVTT